MQGEIYRAVIRRRQVFVSVAGYALYIFDNPAWTGFVSVAGYTIYLFDNAGRKLLGLYPA
jgi:hypothetical protein